VIPCTKIFKGIGSLHNRDAGGPLFVWNITRRCNLRCSHCYSDSQGDYSGRDLSGEKSLSLIEEIRELNPPVVLLTGGEPLLRSNFFDIVKRCKETGLRVGVSTNGTLIDNYMAEKIKNSGIDYVGISIDGREELNDRFRGHPGASLLSWSAIGHLRGLGVKVGIRFTIVDENRDDFNFILEKAVRAGVKRFCLYHLVYSGRGREVKDMALNEKRRFMDGFFKKVKILSQGGEDMEVLTTDSPADGVYMLRNFLGDGNARSSPIDTQGGCSAGDKVLYLDNDGTVYPCQFLRDEPLGNVLDRRLSDIWSDKSNRLIGMLRNKREHLSGRCGSCSYKEMCGGCRARGKANSGSLWAEDPACYLTEDEIYEREDLALSV
jgi:radical SAM protein with 4Fe4S-binding SPASM domain